MSLCRIVLTCAIGIFGCSQEPPQDSFFPISPASAQTLPSQPISPESHAKPSEIPLAHLYREYIRKHNVPNARKTIVVEKENHWMHVYANDRLLKSFRIAIGPNYNDKVREGDKATPEGTFFLEPKRASRFYRPFSISYPTTEDAHRGVGDGIISQKRKREIEQAHKKCQIPKQRSGGLGSYLLIHGGGNGWPEDTNWTHGCIALDNEDIDELHSFVDSGCNRDGTYATTLIVSRGEYKMLPELTARDVLRLSSPAFNPDTSIESYFSNSNDL